jgi:formyl-CoA transferase
MSDLLLTDVRILDLSRVLAGPYCTMVLADYGADVIKVEEPGAGDGTRAWGPPWVGDQSAYFLAANRNKRSITVDLKASEGRQIIHELAAQSDVVIENFKVGGAAKLGIDYVSLAALNPRLVYCSITGYGQTGPYKERAGYDFIIQAQGGVMSITGPEAGEPYKVGVAIADITTGLFAASAILAALHERTRSGKGQAIDVALLDSQIAWLANVAQNYLATGEPPARYGNAHPSIVPYESFPTADGYHRGRHRHGRPVSQVLRGDRTPRPGRRHALRHQRGARRAARRVDPAVAGDLPHADDGGVAGAVQRAQRARRPHQRRGGGAGGSAGAGTRYGAGG